MTASNSGPAKAMARVVAIGASAGGLEAFQKLLDALSQPTGDAFLIVQHLDPDHESALVDLLAGHTQMRVSQAADAVTIEPNHVYTIPPGHRMSVSNEQLRLEPFKTEARPHLPFDHLLISMAQELGSRAVAVVLSGAGSDGSLGIRHIRDKGGAVLVQAPEEAAYDGMPRSAIETGKATHVATVKGIAELLMHLDQAPHAKAPDTKGKIADVSFDKIISLLLTSTAHDFRNYKTGTLQRRIKRRFEDCDKAKGDMEKYIALLQSDPSELDRLMQDLLINVTEFFRDPAVFQQLETEVIPRIIREKAPGLPIRIWIAGCSTGQEAYSLAILFNEALIREGSDAVVQIFASDADPEAVAEAREGLYRDTKGLTANRLEKFFRQEGEAWRVSASLRGMVTFTVHDVLSDPPFSRLDLLSCRNLLIYLKPDAQVRLMGLFHYALVPGGILVLGTAETVGRLDDRFATVSEAARIYRNQRSRVGSDFAQLTALPLDVGASAGSGLVLRRRPFDPAEFLQNKVLEGYTTATALVDPDFQCLYMIGPADKYFQVPPGRPVSGLLAMARDGLAIELRRALEEAARTKTTAVVTGGHLRGTDGPDGFTVVVEPIEHEGQRLYMVSVSPAEPVAAEQTSGGPFNGHIMALERELDETRAELGKALRELQHVSSIQYAALAEAKSVQEEYQASNEELLSSKEELQSLNEELNALNAQLQGTVAREKASANDLQNILYSTDTATLFLDAKLLVRFFTPGIEALFKLRPVDIGRPLAELTLLASDTALFADIVSALKTGARVSADVQTQDGTWFNRSAMPYKTREGDVDGVVITLDEITERKRHEEALEVQTTSASVARARLESAIGSLPDAFAYYDANNVLVLCNAQYRDLHPTLGQHMRPGFRFEQLVPQGQDTRQAADDYAAWIAKRARHRKPLTDNHKLRVADGRWFSLIDTPTPDGGWVNMLIDITGLKTAEQQLSERASAIAEVSEGIAISDAARNLTYMNDTCRTMFGVTKDVDIAGRHWLTFFAVDPAAQVESVNAALLHDRVWRGALAGKRLDGSTLDMDVSLTLMGNGNLVIVTRDVSKRNADQRDRDRLREQLLIAQRREIVNVIAAGLAHDLNNLLAVISASVELMLEQDVQGDAQKPAATPPAFANRLGHILLATQQSSALLNRLIKLGGRELARKQFDMRQSVQEAADLIGVGLAPNIVLGVHLPQTAVNIYADPIDILQIVLNLGLNARDAVGTGPQSITITLSKAKPAQMAGPFDIGAVEAGRPHVSLSVADTGSGIDPTVLAVMFDAYFSTKGAAGTGLGLPMVKEIVTGYGGAIKVETTVGQGSRFTVLLPARSTGQPNAKKAPHGKSTSAVVKKTADLHGHVALVVEDNDEFRDLISSFLEETGLEVIACADPLDALKALHDAPTGCDVLITDFNLPHMNGLQLAEAVARLAPDLPMIMVTASIERCSDKTLVEQNRLFRVVLPKPIKKAQLIAAIATTLD